MPIKKDRVELVVILLLFPTRLNLLHRHVDVLKKAGRIGLRAVVDKGRRLWIQVVNQIATDVVVVEDRAF